MSSVKIRAKTSTRRSHARNQIKHRFGVEVTTNDLLDLEQKIEDGDPDTVFVCTWNNKTGQRSLYLVWIKDTAAYAVYNDKRRSISTFWDEKRKNEVLKI